MRAITIPQPGGPDVLTVAEVPDPRPRPGEVVVHVAAAGVNRADIMQRRGVYDPPPGESDIPGLECAGTVEEVGEGVLDWGVGDEVCALLAGGGYAERVAVPAGQLLPVPAGLGLVEAAALPEVMCTVWSNVFMIGRLAPGEAFLVHGGTSGIGTAAIQLARARGARPFATAGTPEKVRYCLGLGAEAAINYRTEDFVERIHDLTGGTGADVVLDNMGAKYLARNVEALAPNGRLVIIGLQGGVKAELNINTLLRRCGSVIATSLRGRPRAEKAAIVAAVRENVWPLIESGAVRPVVHETFPLAGVGHAHTVMEESTHIGKLVLTT